MDHEVGAGHPRRRGAGDGGMAVPAGEADGVAIGRFGSTESFSFADVHRTHRALPPFHRVPPTIAGLICVDSEGARGIQTNVAAGCLGKCLKTYLTSFGESYLATYTKHV